MVISEKDPDNSSDRLDDLILGDMKIWQGISGYRFSIDAVLLAHFPLLQRVDRVVDLGSGNGIIPLLLSHRRPDMDIVGLELQPDMVRRARRSIIYNRLEGKIEMIEADIKKVEQVLPGQSFDLVTSNPPFWKQGEGKLPACRETAVARHELDITLEELVDKAGYLLAPEGHLVFIQRSQRLPEALRILEDCGFRSTRLRLVQAFQQQEAKLFLLEGKKTASRPPLKILPPLVIYREENDYSEEIRGIYRGEKLLHG